MNILAAVLTLYCSLAVVSAQPQGGGTTETAGVAVDTTADAAALATNAKTLLDADELKAALVAAEAAVAAGGGADAFAARAEAKLALGYPLIEAAEDYAAAARLDPRYGEKYNGLIAQMQSETRRDKSKEARQTGAGGVRMGFVGGLAGAGFSLLAVSFLFLRRKKAVGKSSSEF